MRSIILILAFVFTQNNVLSIMNNGTQNYSTGLNTKFYEILNDTFIYSISLFYLYYTEKVITGIECIQVK